MGDPTARPAPTATGVLAKTPLSHGLVFARNRRLSGTFELAGPGETGGEMSFWRGRVTGVKTTPPVAYFGAVAYELGLIDGETLDATLLELAKREKLHGEILVARGSLTPAQRDDALAEQACRKIHHLFALPPETTTYAFYEARPTSEEPPLALDPLAPIWRGICDHPPEAAVRDVLGRIGISALAMINEGAIERGRFAPDELAVIDALSREPKSVAQVRILGHLAPQRSDLLCYLLVIAKCVEPISGVRTFSSGNMPAVALPTLPPDQRTSSMPAMRVPSVTNMPAVRPSSGQLPAVRPSSGQIPAMPPSSSSLMARANAHPSSAAMRAVQPYVPNAHPSSAAMRAGQPFPSPSSSGNMQAVPPPPMPSGPRTLTPPDAPAASYTPRTSSTVGIAASASPYPPSTGTLPPPGEVRRSSSPKQAAISQPPGSGRPVSSSPRAMGPADLGASGIAIRAQATEREDHFEVLGLATGASIDAVRASYFRLSKLWHPDRLPADLSPFRSEVETIFAAMTRAFQALSDPKMRDEYMRRSGVEPPRPRREVLKEIDAALAKSDFATVEREAKRLTDIDHDDAEALALFAWATAWGGEASEDTLKASLSKLDRAVNMDRTCERASYLRAMMHKRLGNQTAAFRDFVRVTQINPKHVDAQREIRLAEMRARKGGSGEHKLDALITKMKGKK